MGLLLLISGCQQTSPARTKGCWFFCPSENTPPPITNRDCFSSSPTLQRTQNSVFLLAAGANTRGLLKTSIDVQNFSRGGGGHFNIPETHICHLTNAFKAELENALIALKPQLIKGDLVILYFSGHGSHLPDDNGDEQDRWDETLVTRDVEGKDYPRAKDVLRDDQFTALVNALATDRILTVMDTCFSSGMYLAKTEQPNPLLATARSKFFVKGELGTQMPRDRANQDNLIKNEVGEFDALKGLLLAAASENENALEINEGGLFTLKFVEQLEKQGDIKKAFLQAAQEVQDATGSGDVQQTPQAIGDWGVLGDKLIYITHLIFFFNTENTEGHREPQSINF
ncbi:conserved hypothetical protein [Beggiatoa sp. SS]|nr:conserved hypothetical protein [Beggiatoa sp. SS]